MFRHSREAKLLAVVAIVVAMIAKSDAKFPRSNRIADFEVSPPALAALYRQFEQPAMQQQLYRPIGLFRTPEKSPQAAETPHRSSLPRAFGAAMKRSSTFADFHHVHSRATSPFKNCYFSPVQCVLLERRRRK